MVPDSPQDIPRISALDGLHPIFRERLEEGIALARAEGLPVYVFESWRAPERQDWLYASGRTRPGRVVTNARGWSSWHQYLVAADLAFDGEPGTPKVDWSWDGNWKRLGEIMTGRGLDWLGAPGSTFPEAPHFQLTGGLTIMVARMLYDDGGIGAVWAEINKRLKGGIA